LERIAAVDGDRLDLICWKHYGSLSGRVVETALDVNPGLAMESILKAGQVIKLPAVDTKPREQSLW
jgi:phage tail protein X